VAGGSPRVVMRRILAIPESGRACAGQPVLADRITIRPTSRERVEKHAPAERRAGQPRALAEGRQAQREPSCPAGRRPGSRDTAGVSDRNVLGGELEPCGTEPVTGFYRDGCCKTGPEDLGSHTICAVVTAEFLEHQRRIGNDLTTPLPHYRFPGLAPGDRWCVTARNWLRAHEDGAAAYVVLACTHERALDIVPLAALQQHAVDVPEDPGILG
jgi:uncharacterized protein (DUF2237 family)